MSFDGENHRYWKGVALAIFSTPRNERKGKVLELLQRGDPDKKLRDQKRLGKNKIIAMNIE